ncbi:MAG: helix-turn-helix domain-containing protein [Defluviitaleaceae bacterium]|nr:helix-turn-helix domain-containing protein [Defluviitaleaceae bacterium]
MSNIDLARLVMGHIVKGLDNRMTVETVAERFYFSASHLHRVFLHVTGMSVTDFIRVKRLDKAADLLLDTERSILDICLMSGFDTTQTFNRLFRERYGQTPMMFRHRGQRRAGLSPQGVLEEYYYRMAKGAYPMLQPYIVERDTFLLVGRRITLGGSNPSKEDIGWLWQNSGKIHDEINNKVGGGCIGVSLDFQYDLERGKDARHAYMVAAEVSKVEMMAFDHESLAVPASQWVYIPLRYDDPFVKELVPEEHRDDFGHLTGAVFGWARLWMKENGYEEQGWPMYFEVYSLGKGYENEGGPEATLCMPVRKAM